MHPVLILMAALSMGTALFGAPLGNPELQAYFARHVATISSNALSGIKSKAEWDTQKPKLRAELFEMLGLDPARERTDLKPVVTGRIERDGIVVEKLHFQSSPGLYVTANLYLPAKVEKPLPTILYVCGHAIIKTNGVSFGNKVGYQHHGAWFARNGYVCLTIDTIQLGEIEGIHHGTYREGMWWWNSRGYTPAGVEAWNCIRALDYLETRPEVDKARFGVTGRSGGGAYSWWVAALDDRIKVAAPVAGITDLEDHVVDGVVEGHCDCMYIVNTYVWDYPTVAALVAPRPLLICNSDKDTIFPLDGVIRTHSKVANIYKLLGASTNLGLLITEGPHKDTQDLQLPVFRWFNRHLKGEDPVIEMAATRLFTAQELRVFDQIPADEITSKVHETFVPAAQPASARNSSNGRERYESLAKRTLELRSVLRENVFRGWPSEPTPFNEQTRELDEDWTEAEFDSEPQVRLKLYFPRARRSPLSVRIYVSDEEPTPEDLRVKKDNIILVVRNNPGADARTALQIRRRYMLMGQTLDGMRVWDILRGIQFVRSMPEMSSVRIDLDSTYHPESVVLAKILSADPDIGKAPPMRDAPDAQRPDYLNLLRFTSWDEIQVLGSFWMLEDKKAKLRGE